MNEPPEQEPKVDAPEVAVEADDSYHLIGRPEPREQRNIFHISLGLLAVIAGYYGFSAKVEDVLHLYLGLAILVLAALPMIFWLKSGGSRFPVFEPIMLLCAGAYALPLLTGHESVSTYPPETITLAGFAVVLYEVSAIAAYALTRGLPGRGGFWRDTVLTSEIERWVSYGLVLSTVYIGIS
ncbi:MAG TPA: hypothetical protein VFJ90_07065, partial [Candidatus Didemnitutus sp.]|nr:hypothetical protein [Candidatus Didemnitutus sp.]